MQTQNTKRYLTLTHLPFWRRWVSLFLFYLPVEWWIQKTFPSRIFPEKQEWWYLIVYSLFMSLVFTAAFASTSSEPTESDDSKRGKSIPLYVVPGALCAIVGGVSCLTQIFAGRPGIGYVAGFTLGIPLWSILIYRFIIVSPRAPRTEGAASSTITADNPSL